MAYGTEGPGGTEVPYFSSPDYTYKNVAVGNVSHDNTLTLSRTFAAVAQWRDEKGSEIGGSATSEPLDWVTSRATAFSRARAQGKKVFLICGRDTCPNTMSTRNYSCEDSSVKRYLQNDYVCWYNNCEEQYEEAYQYFTRGDVGNTLPFIAVIDAANDRALAAEGGYHSASDLSLMLERVANGIVFPAPLTWLTNGSAAIEEAKRDGKLILFVGGRETCGNTIGTRDFTCEEPEVRAALANYVLWFCDCDKYTDVFWQYGSGLGTITLPLVCVINPSSPKKYIARKTGYQNVKGMLSLLKAAAPRTVTFNTNGGELDERVRNVMPKSAIGKLPVPTKAGYAFKGWYTKKKGGTKITAKTKVTKNVTYYAQWMPRKYAVKAVKEGKGTVSGTGSKTYKSKVALKAAPAKGYVFLGWYLDDVLKSQKAKYSFTVPLGGVTYKAKFITKAVDKAGIGMEFGGVGFGAMADDGGSGGSALPVVTNTCGVVTTWPVGAAGLTPVSVSVKGQPKGMKYDANKKAVTGVPSVANKSGTMTITVKSAGASRSWKAKWRIVALPAFARGTFNGWSYVVGGETAEMSRKATVSVTGAGKISAKVGTLAFSRTGWTVGDDGAYVATMRTVRTVGTGKKAKKYTDVLTLRLDPDAAWTADQLTGTVATYNGNVALADALAALDGGESAPVPLNADAIVSVRRNPFGDNADAKALAAELAALGTQKWMDAEELVWNLKVASNGVATISRTTGSGKNKKTTSATAVVVWNGDGHVPYADILVGGKIVEVNWQPLP